jgi:DNA invertase Pin-like site-specific DNA recombinase
MNLNHLGVFDRVYCYGRVSSSEQADDRRNSIEVQESRLKGINPKPDRLYRDVQAGDSPDRPEFNRMVDQIRADAGAGLTVLLVVTEQSRLSRDSGVSRLIEEFDDIGVCVFALDGGRLTVKEPHEWLSVSTTGMFNQYFLRQHRRVLRGAKAQRRLEGRPVSVRPPYGYKYTRDKYIRDDETWAIARSCVLKYLPLPIGEGQSLRECQRFAKSIGWAVGHTGFRKWMTNPILRGHLAYNEGGLTRDEAAKGIIHGMKPLDWRLNTHEALITDAEFALIEKRFIENRQYARQGTNRPREPLSGLVICGLCGRKMHFNYIIDKRYGRKYPNYVCNVALCDRKVSVSKGIIEDSLLKVLSDRAEDLATGVVEGSVEAVVDPEVLELERQMRELKRMHDRTPMAGLKSAMSEIETKINAKTQSLPAARSDELLRGLLQIFKSGDLINLPQPELRAVYHDLVKSITCSRPGGKRSPVQIVIELNV